MLSPVVWATEPMNCHTGNFDATTTTAALQARCRDPVRLYACQVICSPACLAFPILHNDYCD